MEATRKKRFIKKIKKENKRAKNGRRPSVSQTADQHMIKDAKPVEGLPVSLKDICKLSQQEQAEIRDKHKSLAQYVFMKERQKAKFFHIINQEYRKKIKPQFPPGSAPQKKTIKFKKRFELKYFNSEQKSKEVAYVKISKEKAIRNIHFI